jgi:SUMO ligase MMS21 Smc5/6 complex component
VPTPTPAYANLPEPIPRRIAWLVAEDASKNSETCSITLDEISPITASVTTCFHVFNSDAIAKWLTTNPLCPMCKKRCQATVAFEDLPPPLAVD